MEETSSKSRFSSPVGFFFLSNLVLARSVVLSFAFRLVSGKFVFHFTKWLRLEGESTGEIDQKSRKFQNSCQTEAYSSNGSEGNVDFLLRSKENASYEELGVAELRWPSEDEREFCHGILVENTLNRESILQVNDRYNYY